MESNERAKLVHRQCLSLLYKVRDDARNTLAATEATIAVLERENGDGPLPPKQSSHTEMSEWKRLPAKYACKCASCKSQIAMGDICFWKRFEGTKCQLCGQGL